MTDGGGGSDGLLVATIVGLVLISGVLALAETAFVRLSRVRVLALEDEGRPGAARLARLLETPEKTLNAVLLLVLVTQLTAATLVGVLVDGRLGPFGVVAGLAIEVTFFFVAAEVIPKTFAVQHTDAVALRLSRLLAVLTGFLPLRALSQALISLANVILPGKGLREGPFITREELRVMADVAADEEEIERDERRLIHSIFEFRDLVVREVMVPRPDMFTVPVTSSIDAALAAAITGGYSRMPVTGETADDITGLVYLKDLSREGRARSGDQALASVQGLVRPAVFVPEQKRVAELLREMQSQKVHMAMVVDEYGGIAGLVTLEDLLEEIVGEIVDEYDVEEPKVEDLGGGVLRVAGHVSIDDVNEVLDVELPATEWDTVGGLVLNLLGHLPEEGETVEFQGLEFRSEQVRARRIVSVRISRLEAHEEPATAGAG